MPHCRPWRRPRQIEFMYVLQLMLAQHALRCGKYLLALGRQAGVGAATLDDGNAELFFNLETAVGRARVGRHGVGWQGATTRRTAVRKEEQRRQRAPGRRNRVRSAATQKVSSCVGE